MTLITRLPGIQDSYHAGLEALALAWQPPELDPVSGWADKYRHLAKSTSSEPGQWRNTRIPFLAGVMDALDHNHPSPIVCFVKSSQVGGSECGLNWIGRTVHQTPSSFLALFPTEKVGRKWVRTRLDSMIAATPVLREILPRGVKTSGGNTLQEKHYKGGVLYTGSANIPDDVASISVPNLLLDEVDRMPVTLEDEGDPIELALRRSTTFPRSKAFLVSTPTTEETSRIWQVWRSSTMGRYYVPCPDCGHMQFLVWKQVKWVEGKPDGARYLCESCGVLFEERHKTQFLRQGEWRFDHPDRINEVSGFHINGLYTPIGLGDSWARHARAWERAQGSSARIQVFTNTRMGEVHKGDREKLEWEEIQARAEPYKLGVVDDTVLVLTSGTDVQGDRLECQVLGHARGERIQVVDYRVFYGDTTRPEVWDELDEYLRGEWNRADGSTIRMKCSLIDSGFLPEVVLGFTRTRQNLGVYASRGSSVANKFPIGRPSYPDVKRRGAQDKRGAERYDLGVSSLKHWVYEQLKADAGTADVPVLPLDRHVRFSEDLPAEYYRQLVAEVFDPRNGWVERANYHRNEALDTFCLARAAAMHHSIAIHRLREGDWARLEQQRVKAPGPEAETAEAPVSRAKQPMSLPGGLMPVSAVVRRG